MQHIIHTLFLRYPNQNYNLFFLTPELLWQLHSVCLSFDFVHSLLLRDKDLNDQINSDKSSYVPANGKSKKLKQIVSKHNLNLLLVESRCMCSSVNYFWKIFILFDKKWTIQTQVYWTVTKTTKNLKMNIKKFENIVATCRK